MPSNLSCKYSLTHIVGLFCFWPLLFLNIGVANAESCPTKKIDHYGFVKQVYDGDTLQLANGDKIRLIGVNAPEMNYKTGNPDPYAKQATQYLRKKILKKRIGIRYGSSPKDKYKRHLAHVFLSDGTNIQAELIRNGYAFSIAIPPNLWQQRCYQSLEKEARTSSKGLWKKKFYRPIDANSINKQKLGFSRVKGTIQSIKETKKSYWLNLTDKMALRIDKRDMKYFSSFDQHKWLGKEIIAKGWISHRKKRYSMRIKHPAAIEKF